MSAIWTYGAAHLAARNEDSDLIRKGSVDAGKRMQIYFPQ